MHNEKKWTVAEGAVYVDYNDKIHKIDAPPDDIKRYYAGVDWGYDHNGTIVILADDYKGNTYIVDGIAEQYKHIDWWVARAKELQRKYGDISFYCDTARTEHIADFKRNGIKAVYSNKSVISGIEEVAKRFKNNSLFYVAGVLPRFEEEIFQYRWRENSKKDEVEKEYDDVLDALRYAIYTQHLIDSRNTADINAKIRTAKRLFG